VYLSLGSGPSDNANQFEMRVGALRIYSGPEKLKQTDVDYNYLQLADRYTIVESSSRRRLEDAIEVLDERAKEDQDEELAAKLKLRLKMDFDEQYKTDPSKFEYEYRKELAKALNVSDDQIVIDGVERGSVIVGFHVKDHPHAASAISNQLDNEDSALMQSHLMKSVDKNYPLESPTMQTLNSSNSRVPGIMGNETGTVQARKGRKLLWCPYYSGECAIARNPAGEAHQLMWGDNQDVAQLIKMSSTFSSVHGGICILGGGGGQMALVRADGVLTLNSSEFLLR
jgi:hypothetical protein